LLGELDVFAGSFTVYQSLPSLVIQRQYPKVLCVEKDVVRVEEGVLRRLPPSAREADAVPTPSAEARPEPLATQPGETTTAEPAQAPLEGPLERPVALPGAPVVAEQAPVTKAAAVERRKRRQPARPRVLAALHALYGDDVPSRRVLADDVLLAAVVKQVRDDILKTLHPDGVLTDRELDTAVRQYLKDHGEGPIKLDTVLRASGRRIDKSRARK
jgi:hypothetical protein